MRLALVALLAALTACGDSSMPDAGDTGAHGWCHMTTSRRAQVGGTCVTDGVPLTWHRRCSSYRFYNYSPEMTPADVQATAARAFGAWTDITCAVDGGTTMPRLEVHMGPEMSECGRAQYVSGGPNVGSIVFVPTGDWDRRGYDGAAYAVTTVWHNTHDGEIYDVDMEINEDRGPYTLCPDTGCPDTSHVDLLDVMTHEAGHWFGMAHSGDGTATMYFAAPPGETEKRTLEADDIAGFCDDYADADLGLTCDDTPRGGLGLTCGCPEMDGGAADGSADAGDAGTPGVCNVGGTGGCCAVGGGGRTVAGLTETWLLAACVLAFLAWRRRRGGAA